MTIYHDGTKIPIAPPKDSNSDITRGFQYELENGETIITSDWLINETPVTPNTTVNGLTMKMKYFVNNITKINLTGGELGRTYLITNRIRTNKTVQDDRSFYLKVIKL